MALKSIFLIRHAESLEDVDPTLHNVSDDRIITLTDCGITQADNLWKKLSGRFCATDKLVAYISPSYRAVATWNIMSHHLSVALSVYTEARIRNLNWGNVTLETRAQIEQERYKAGVLNYHFPYGENTPEYVFNIDEFTAQAVGNRKTIESPDFVVIVTHGFALRIIARFLLHISDTDFRWLRNPPNGYCLELQYNVSQDHFFTTAPLLRIQPIE